MTGGNHLNAKRTGGSNDARVGATVRLTGGRGTQTRVRETNGTDETKYTYVYTFNGKIPIVIHSGPRSLTDVYLRTHGVSGRAATGLSMAPAVFRRGVPGRNRILIEINGS